MQATGIIRRMDDLGRVVIPKEIRRLVGMGEGDAYEIFVSNDTLVLKPYHYNISSDLNAIIAKAGACGAYSYEIIKELQKIADKLSKEEEN